MKLGAYDYISKPFRSDEVLLTLRKAEERERLIKENVILKRELHKEYSFHNIITKNPDLLEILETIKKIAEYKSTVLIEGESGTGKELIARAIHYSSLRSDCPFVPVNCGAIPENLLESELFGHVKGAFTDASCSKKGLFEEADEGTLFLDEIGELPLMLQVKLLRVLQEEEIRRVGDTRAIPIDVRIIAASIRDLAQEVKEGRFRGDLFYRLNVLALNLPPLRERREDIPLLADAFIKRYNERLHKNIKGIDKEALSVIFDHSWEGNVRELENTIERAVALTEGDRIKLDNLPANIRETEPKGDLILPPHELSIKKVSKQMEKELIKRALQKSKGNRTQAAKMLEISHRALLYKIKDYGIPKEDKAVDKKGK
jgi:two-component system response regulator AtoC